MPCNSGEREGKRRAYIERPKAREMRFGEACTPLAVLSLEDPPALPGGICMKLKRHPGVAAGSAPAAGTAPRGHYLVHRVVKLMSVTAVAAATCDLWALAASEATHQ